MAATSKHDRRKSAMKRAAMLVRERYVSGHWLYRKPNRASGTQEAHWSPGYGFDALRKQIERNGVGNPDDTCRVCAEGAIYLACAMDPKLTERDALDLIQIANEVTFEETDHRYTAVMELNDSRRTVAEGKKQIGEVLEKAVDRV